MKNSQRISHTHLQFAQCQLHKPKIAKEYVLPTLSAERKIKYENTTKYKNNSRNSSKYEHCSPQHISSKLKNSASEIDYYSYTNRYLQADHRKIKPKKIMNTLFYENLEQKIISNLINAKKEIKIAVAWFTNPKIYNLIYQLVKENISVDLILSDDAINFGNPKVDFQELINLGANIRTSKPPNLMHNKFCVIDNRILITGSYNWTSRAEKYNFENIIISTDKELINAFNKYFTILISKTSLQINIPEYEFETYLSEKEFKIEKELTENLEIEVFDINKTEKENANLEIEKNISKAHLLYLNIKHKECINYCDKMLIKHPNTPEFHIIKSLSYSRTNEVKKQIISAEKAIEINNEKYAAYNLLGIGYSKTKGKEQLSIKNYNICLSKLPNEHLYLRNRALSYIDLENDLNIPKNIRDKFKNKANLDLDLIIHLFAKQTYENLPYSTIFSVALAYELRNQINKAKKYIDLAILKYKETKNKYELDKNELNEMKIMQREINRIKKSL